MAKENSYIFLGMSDEAIAYRKDASVSSGCSIKSRFCIANGQKMGPKAFDKLQWICYFNERLIYMSIF